METGRRVLARLQKWSLTFALSLILTQLFHSSLCSIPNPNANPNPDPNSKPHSNPPWAVESVWIDGDWQAGSRSHPHTNPHLCLDAPLRIMAPLCLKSTDARIFLKLADGTTYSIDASMLSDGAEHEVATAGDGALLARLTHMQPPTQPPTQPPPTQPPTPTPTHARADARTDVHARKPAPASPHASTTAAVRAGPKG
eukprot:3215732-Pleurochrysis_carterae.AAC.1